MLEQNLINYHKYKSHNLDGLEFYSKAGLRFLPKHTGLEMMKAKIQPIGQFMDISSSAGYLASYKNSIILDTSLASLRAAQKTYDNKIIAAASIWDFNKEVDSLAIILSTDKGNARVNAEILGAYKNLKIGGQGYFLVHKNQGAKRYEKEIKSTFGNIKIIAKSSGWRLSKAIKNDNKEITVPWLNFSAANLKLKAQAGVYAAGKLDPGTKFFLEQLDFAQFKNKTLLDIGTGYGILSLKASLAGATVSALDDDLLAIQSCYQNSIQYGLDIRCLHSDVNSSLKDTDLYDVVITNPPFHVGKGVELLLPFAFIAAAYKHLKVGGELFLVANKALAYEPLLAEFKSWKELANNKSFKVLWAKK